MLNDYLIDAPDNVTTDAGTFRVRYYADPDPMPFDEEDMPEGGYVGYVIERMVDPHGDADPDDDATQWEHTDSCWSIDPYDYAVEMALDMIAFYRPDHFPSPVLAVQV